MYILAEEHGIAWDKNNILKIFCLTDIYNLYFLYKSVLSHFLLKKDSISSWEDLHMPIVFAFWMINFKLKCFEFNPRSHHTKVFKIVFDASLLNTQQYKVHIKGKVEQSQERSSVLPYTLV